MTKLIRALVFALAAASGAVYPLAAQKPTRPTPRPPVVQPLAGQCGLSASNPCRPGIVLNPTLEGAVTRPPESGPYIYSVWLYNYGQVGGDYDLNCSGVQLTCSASPNVFSLAVGDSQSIQISYSTLGLGAFNYTLNVFASPADGPPTYKAPQSAAFLGGKVTTQGAAIVTHMNPPASGQLFGTDSMKALYYHPSGINTTSVKLLLDGVDSTTKAVKSSAGYAAGVNPTDGYHTWTTYACATNGRCDSVTTTFDRAGATNWAMDDSLPPDGSSSGGNLLGPLNPPPISQRGCAVDTGDPEITFVTPAAFLTQATPNGRVFIAMVDTSTVTFNITTQTLAWIPNKSRACSWFSYLNRGQFDYSFFSSASPTDPRWTSYPYGDLVFGRFRASEFDWLEPDAFELAFGEPQRHGPSAPLRVPVAPQVGPVDPPPPTPARLPVMLPDPGPIDSLSWRVELNGTAIIVNSQAVVGSGVTNIVPGRLFQSAQVPVGNLNTITNGGWNEMVAYIKDQSGHQTAIRTRFLMEGGAAGSPASIAMTVLRDFRHVDMGECAAFAAFQCDGVMLTQPLPGFVTRDKARGLNLVYRSNSQRIPVAIPVQLTIARAQRVPDSLWIIPYGQGVYHPNRISRYAGKIGAVTGVNASNINENRDEIRIVAAEREAAATGDAEMYETQIQLRSFYVGTQYADPPLIDTRNKTLARTYLTTRAATRFGQGWQLAEVSRLIFTDGTAGLRFEGDTAAIWLAGDGSQTVFRKPGSTWLAPPGDNTKMVRLASLDAGARYVFYLESGAKIGFRDDGWQVWTRDLVGNTTTFIYENTTSNRLDSIADPSGKKFKFTYYVGGKLDGYAKSMYLQLTATATDTATINVFSYDTLSDPASVRLAKVRTLRSATLADSVRFTYKATAKAAFIDSVIAPGDTLGKRMVSRFTWDTAMGTPETMIRPLGGVASFRSATRRASPRTGYGRFTGGPLERTIQINQWRGTYIPFAGLPYDYLADPFGGPTYVRHDGATYTDRNGLVSADVRHIVRDTMGRVLRVVQNRYDPSQSDSVVYHYDALGRADTVIRTTKEFRAGSSRTLDTLSFVFDTAQLASGVWCSRLRVTRDPFKAQTKVLYDSTNANAAGRCLPSQFIGTAADTTKFTYGTLAAGNPWAVRPVSVRDVFGNVTTVSYNTANWNSEVVTEPLSTITRSYYDIYGRADSVKDPAGIVTRFLKDRLGRVTHSRTGTGLLAPATRTTYNAAGQVVATDVYAANDDITVVPSGAQTTRTFYDALGRIDSILNPGSRTASGTAFKARKQSWALRDGFGNPRWEYPGNGMYRSYIYDAQGRPTRIEDGPGWSNQSQDGERRADTRTAAWVDSLALTMGKVTNSGAVHKLEYDAKGRLVKTGTDDPFMPDTSIVNRAYQYSKGDQLIMETVSWLEGGGATVVRRYEYDRRGNRTLALDSTYATGISTTLESVGRLVYAYDSLTGRLDSVIGTVSGNGISTQYGKVRFYYDRGGRDTLHVSRAGPADSAVKTRTAFDALGRLAGTETKVFTTQHYSMGTIVYSTAGDMNSYETVEPGSNNGSHQYTYSTDGTRRLLNAAEGTLAPNTPAYVKTYTYDVYGNRQTQTSSANFNGSGLCTRVKTTTYDPDNRGLREIPSVVDSNCKMVRYFTDQAGRRVGESDTTQALPPGLPPIAGLRSLMTYTAGGQLYFSVTPGGSLTYDVNWHWYDAQGRRVMSQIANLNTLYPWPHPDSTGAARTYYVYDGSDVALELVRTGGTWRVDRRFITGGVDRQMVGRLYQNGFKNYVFVSNFQGTTVKVLKSDGTEETATGYFARDPYGALVGVTGSGGQPLGGLGYTGAGTPNARGGFVYMRNRWYDPQTGRFLTQDPIGLAGGVNLYAYAGNNPISFDDPFGLWPTLSSTLLPKLYTGAMSLWHQTFGTARDFKSNYDAMKDANTIGSDKYFHCKANCQGTRRGSIGEFTAKAISLIREITDVARGKSNVDSSRADMKANSAGREGAKSKPDESCVDVCQPQRPRGLPEKY